MSIQIQGNTIIDDSRNIISANGAQYSGNIVMSASATVTGLPTPVNSTDAASKTYVDTAVAGAGGGGGAPPFSAFGVTF